MYTQCTRRTKIINVCQNIYEIPFRDDYLTTYHVIDLDQKFHKLSDTTDLQLEEYGNVILCSLTDKFYYTDIYIYY